VERRDTPTKRVGYVLSRRLGLAQHRYIIASTRPNHLADDVALSPDRRFWQDSKATCAKDEGCFPIAHLKSAAMDVIVHTWTMEADMPIPARENLQEIGPGPLIVDADRFAGGNRRRLSGPGMRTFLNIADVWGLGESDRLRVLGFPGRSTYYGWVSRARSGENLELPVDTLLRISAILGIWKALRILFESDAEGIEWLTGPNDAPTFGGQPPMHLVTSGTQDGIMIVRRYLDGMRGGLFAAPNAADTDFRPLTDDDIVFA